MPKSWTSSHRRGRCWTSGEMIGAGAPMSASALAITNAFRPVSASNGTSAIWSLPSSSMSTPPWWVMVMVGAR